jgi:hypothetical protein
MFGTSVRSRQNATAKITANSQNTFQPEFIAISSSSFSCVSHGGRGQRLMLINPPYNCWFHFDSAKKNARIVQE